MNVGDYVSFLLSAEYGYPANVEAEVLDLFGEEEVLIRLPPKPGVEGKGLALVCSPDFLMGVEYVIVYGGVEDVPMSVFGVFPSRKAAVEAIPMYTPPDDVPVHVCPLMK